MNFKSCKEKAVQKSINTIESNVSQVSQADLISVQEVVEKINHLKIKKAPGPDAIPNVALKHFPLQLVKLLTRIFNNCLSIFYFPLEWKIAKVIAIPKPGKDKKTPSNHRPISLLPNMGKVFEGLILDRLSRFDDLHDVLAQHQFGFRKFHSTIHQVLRITEFASLNFNRNKSTGLVLLDIEKAFDSVWHHGLLHKLHVNKFPMHLIRIIKSYLENRRSFVEFLGGRSLNYQTPAGVPQGSLLSPFLFIIFINDIVSPKNCHIATYADDTAIFCEAPWKNINSIKSILEKSLSSVEKFFVNWKIKINDTKTEFMVFTKSRVMRQKLPLNPPSFKNNPHVWNDSVKYLGVHLDSNSTLESILTAL